MIVKKDIFFASVEGTEQRNYFLDLYLHSPVVQADCVRQAKDSYEDNNQLRKYTPRPDNHTHHKYRQTMEGNECSNEGEENGPSKQNASEDDCFSRQSNTQRPFVIFIHGGGWRRGAREAWKHYIYYDVNFLVAIFLFLFGTYRNIGESLAERGVGCAVISYPLSEATLGFLCFEMFISYLQCCVVVLPVVFVLSYFSAVLDIYNPYNLLSNNTLTDDIITLIYMTTVAVNFLTIIVMCLKRDQMKINITHLRWYLTSLIFVLFALSVSEKCFQLVKYGLLVLTFVVNQFFIINRRLSRRMTNYEHQLHVLAQAVRWARNLSQTTPEVDPNNLFLMGHSAGGHLASLITLDERHLNKVHCSPKNIRGVISVSGVYCLRTLTGLLLKPLYLVPAFGHRPDIWLQASPAHLLRKAKSQSNIACCKINTAISCCNNNREDLYSDKVSSKALKKDSIEFNRRSYIGDTCNIRAKNCCRLAKDDMCCEQLKNRLTFSSMPSFLLISAERDSILKKQAIEFFHLLKDVGVNSIHVEIMGTNHFSIVTGVDSEKQRGTGSVISHVTGFIQFC